MLFLSLHYWDNFTPCSERNVVTVGFISFFSHLLLNNNLITLFTDQVSDENRPLEIESSQVCLCTPFLLWYFSIVDAMSCGTLNINISVWCILENCV